MVRGQQEIGFLERFATAPDRRAVLAELIPGTEEYFYFHCLHYQNVGQLAEAQAILGQWRSKLGDTQTAMQMHSRQTLLVYSQNPQTTLDYLRDTLGLDFHHSPPSRDRAAELTSKFDNASLSTDLLLDQVMAEDPGLNEIEPSGLGLLLDKQMAPQQLRSVLQRLQRADLPNVVKRIAEELSLKDSKGFGWAAVHQRLSLAQLDELLKLRSQLLEQDNFVRAYAARLAPAEGNSLTDRDEMRAYLTRLATFARKLPASQNSFKALVLGNLLRLEMSEGKYDRILFVEYLSLPRHAAYYDMQRFRNQAVPVAELGYVMNPQVALPPMGDDASLVRRYLEEFLRSSDNVDAFAKLLNREYLERVQAETKILYGIGDAATWYAKLPAAEQKSLRERVEMRFAPQNQNHYQATDRVSLMVELKNVPQLIVKIYRINTLNHYRNRLQPISTDIDLDGLVANVEKKLEYSQPAQLRHAETIDLSELDDRGVWVVDLLGGGQRSRAVIQKGNLVALQRLGDAGHVFQIIDEKGDLLKSAHIELGGRTYPADSEGRIILPYAEQTVDRNILLVDGGFAALAAIVHHAEEYELRAGFMLDRQSLVAGKQVAVAMRTQLTCNRRPISIKLLEDATLTIVATDIEGIATSQVVSSLGLDDNDEYVHTFVVPQRLASLSFQLQGRVFNQSRDDRQSVSTNHTVSCNGIQGSSQIADLFLRQSASGYRLLALGRNGEPIARLPISLSFKVQHFTRQVMADLASDDAGVVELGALANVTEVMASAQGIAACSFALNRFHRHWPAVVHLGLGDKITLPLGKDSAAVDQFGLYEFRRNLPFGTPTGKVKVAAGALEVGELAAGDYVLRDYESGQQVRILVANAKASAGSILAAKHRVLQASPSTSVVIRRVVVEAGKLMVEIAGADASTRVHLVANALYPESSSGRQLHMPYAPLMQQPRVPSLSMYVDSLKLDEEYSYILDRQGVAKYPGNMLAQPTLLVRPWEVSVTENTDKAAAAGDALPKIAAQMNAPASPADAGAAGSAAAARPDWRCFDFLNTPTALATNLEVEDGKVMIPIEDLKGYSSLSVVAVQMQGCDSREIVLPDNQLLVRDQRLRSAFSRDVHLSQTQRVEWIQNGEKKLLGDPRTRRVQTYASIGDVFRLYGTLLKNPEWDKFQFVAKWHQLTEQQKRSHYNEMACHELNFFLFHKDRKFFDSVVQSLLKQKLEKQLVDHWLLGDSLAAFDQLWRVQRLNTLERILLAQSVQSRKPGTARWLSDFVGAFPLDPQARASRFEAALRGMALDNPTSLESLSRFDFLGANDVKDGLVAESEFGLDQAANFFSHRQLESAERSLGGMGGGVEANVEAKQGRRFSRGIAPGKPMEIDRRLGEQLRQTMFTSLDKTREWAETQYYRVRLQQQSPGLIPANPFWKEYLDSLGNGPFLPKSMDLPTSSINEALCALAVIDLPLDATAPEVTIDNEQLAVTAKQPAVVFIESIEKAGDANGQSTVLAGQDVYLAEPDTSEDANRPVQGPLLKGVPYRASVVVTNPTNEQQLVQVLTQLPAGSMPLTASKLTRNTPVDLAPYSTAQVQFTFYFPAEGEFEHYGSQISRAGAHVAATESRTHRVLAKPESVDESTWGYVADWGTAAQVMDFLKKTNLQKLDLDRIAFRMQDKAFFTEATSFLAANNMYQPSLWAYAVMHNEPREIQHLLQNRPDFIGQLGPAFSSPLVNVSPGEQMSYEHLDYKPLVVARIHRLGAKPVILNASLFAQYNRLLNVIAHQPAASPAQCMELCYYQLLQNRINEALEWFDKVDPSQLTSKLQYDYFSAYLNFYRGKYDEAAQVANGYAEYPVLMWKDLFAQVSDQVRQRKAILAGQDIASVTSLDGNSSRQQRMLTDGREARQTEAAAESPTLDLVNQDGSLSMDYRNLKDVEVNYYLMDIELLFSRNPFVSRSGDSVPVIEPNLRERLSLESATGSRRLELPAQLKNRNLLVEVTSQGISRSSVVTANSLAVTMVESFGRLQVLAAQGRTPVEQAYVKVYARNKDGSVTFFKDGYTDLRGQFDYATLSTSALDNVERFSILVLHDSLGAVVKEVAPPTR